MVDAASLLTLDLPLAVGCRRLHKSALLRYFPFLAVITGPSSCALECFSVSQAANNKLLVELDANPLLSSTAFGAGRASRLVGEAVGPTSAPAAENGARRSCRHRMGR